MEDMLSQAFSEFLLVLYLKTSYASVLISKNAQNCTIGENDNKKLMVKRTKRQVDNAEKFFSNIIVEHFMLKI